jgi:hypothetical protein
LTHALLRQWHNFCHRKHRLNRGNRLFRLLQKFLPSSLCRSETRNRAQDRLGDGRGDSRIERRKWVTYPAPCVADFVSAELAGGTRPVRPANASEPSMTPRTRRVVLHGILMNGIGNMYRDPQRIAEPVTHQVNPMRGDVEQRSWWPRQTPVFRSHFGKSTRAHSASRSARSAFHPWRSFCR